MTQAPVEVPIGSIFSEWTVISAVPRVPYGRSQYVCQCSCGEVQNIDSHRLRNGGSNKCRKCWILGQNNHAHVGPIHGRYLTRLKDGARHRNLEVTITMEDLHEIWVAQKGICVLSGYELTLMANARDSTGTASVDRIDSLGQYSRDNIQWVHKDVNKMKLDIPEPYFFQLCHAVSSNKEHTKKLRGARPWLKGS